MSLDYNKVISQVQEMAKYLKLRYEDRVKKLNFAIEILNSNSIDFNKLNKKIQLAKTTWLVPILKGEINNTVSMKDDLNDYIVIASDGSHIDIDRHHSANCFLINIGLVKFQYGKTPSAELQNEPYLYYKDNEVNIGISIGKQIPIDGQILALKRSNEECKFLMREIIKVDSNIPVLGLLDGTLVLWGLVGQDNQDLLVDEFLINSFLKYLDELKKFSVGKQMALCSYISYPRSTEVVNALRIAVCPYEEVNCDFYCSDKISKECDKLSGLIDRDIYWHLLKVGERSSVFVSRSSIVEKYYGDHLVNFFYVKLENEVARVEIPKWVADNYELINLVHKIIVKQCELGLGYPVALMEAHEKAVISGIEREQFWHYIEQVFSGDNIKFNTSAKKWSKKLRWV